MMERLVDLFEGQNFSDGWFKYPLAHQLHGISCIALRTISGADDFKLALRDSDGVDRGKLSFFTDYDDSTTAIERGGADGHGDGGPHAVEGDVGAVAARKVHHA